MAPAYTIREPRPSASEASSARKAGRVKSLLGVGLVVVLALAAGAVAWYVLRDDDNSSAPPAPTAVASGSVPGAGPVAISPAGLRTLQRAIGHPIYWAGRRPGSTYEVTQKRDGTIYVRYLPRGLEVGDTRDDFLIVVTYPYPNALQALRRVEDGKGISVPGGASAGRRGIREKRPSRLPEGELPDRGLRPVARGRATGGHVGAGSTSRIGRVCGRPLAGPAGS